MDRAILERRVQREVATPHFHPGGFPRQQRQGDADIAGIAQQCVRVIHAERQPDQGGDRGQGDIALVERELDAQHIGTIPLAFADNAEVRDRSGIGAGKRPGQAKAGHLDAAG